MHVQVILQNGLKKITALCLIAALSLHTLVTLPNHINAGRSFVALYNYCLQEDDNLNLLEFIGDKLLCAGFDPTEQQETHKNGSHPFVPVPNTAAISFSILFFHPLHIFNNILYFIPQQPYTVITTFNGLATGYIGNVFHPPLPTVI
ncbi:hypothetical protein [Hydrotalea sp.]|uniref:hypothetical protein n=1 Tax=Hydrotalea sp. TaxID=2881279 RepID=UPI003D0B781A